MKKLFLFFTATAMSATMAFAGNDYKINDANIDNMFANADEISFASNDFGGTNFMTPAGPEKTKGGYLVRAFFCGGFALHRSYMGTAGKTLWYMYLCIPVVGGVVGCVDFWGVVFGSIDFNKYKDNGKYIVWMD